MRSLVTATIILTLALVAFGHQASDHLETRIVGGSTAPKGKYPYVVSLKVYFVHFCGGSILNDRWILTAAQCIVNKRADMISVIAGTNYIFEAGQMYQAIFKTTHPKYDGTKLINDIGLILVSRQIVFTDKIQPVALPTENFNKVNYPAVVCGWGTLSLGGSFAQHLQQLNVTVISQAVCAAKQNKLRSSNICSQNEEGEGVCHGDSGDPLLADGIQIGIVSYGNPCAKGYPDIYTRVWSFIDWMNSIIKKHNRPQRSIER